MTPLEGLEHLGPEFWYRVEPDPDSDCLIFKTDSIRPTWRGKSLISVVGGGPNTHRACRRLRCVNPDHIQEGRWHPGSPRALRVRKAPGAYERAYLQC